ncbi:hypothetical protein HYU13_01290 [Candidatus Woesearchaeota archaeon]|nr:hypothetical protein [Candidatus Woesearchaeota archaeon]
MDWKLYMNDNPATSGVGFRAPSPTGQLINNQYPAEVFFGFGLDDKGRAFIGKVGYIWDAHGEKLGDSGQYTYIFDPEGNLVNQLNGWQMSGGGHPFPVLKKDVTDFSQSANDLKIAHPSLAASLDACVNSLIREHIEYVRIFPQYR